MFYFVIFFILILVRWLYQIRTRQMTILARNGIPGPRPNLLTGSLFDHLSKPNVLQYDDYLRRYGPITGYYIGQRPFVLITDLELIRRVQIDDFHRNFHARQKQILKYDLHPNPRLFHNLLNEDGHKWKVMRSILSAGFCGKYLKTMMNDIEKCVELMLDKIEIFCASGKEFDIYEHFQLMTTDVISRCALGVETNIQSNPHDRFFQAAKRFFDSDHDKFTALFLCFPQLDFVLYPIRRLIEIVKKFCGLSEEVIIAELIENVVESRLKSNCRRNDLLQLMLDSLSTVSSDGGDSLSYDEIVSNAVFLYEAGYETTSTALAFIVHILITKPDIQENVREEVMKMNREKGDARLDYHWLGQLPYLHCVILESLRMYPPLTTFTTRGLDRDYRYGNMTIPSVATVRIPTYQLHHSEQFWPDHSNFNPNRFVDNPSLANWIAFQPFGSGPRSCLGKQFAMLEMKLTLVTLLMNYRLVATEKTEPNLPIQHSMLTATPKNGVWLKVISVGDELIDLNY